MKAQIAGAGQAIKRHGRAQLFPKVVSRTRQSRQRKIKIKAAKIDALTFPPCFFPPLRRFDENSEKDECVSELREMESERSEK